MYIDLFIGGCSGVISRSLTAPLELYKLQRQNSFMPNSTIKDVIKKEGIQHLWKGNATNCLRVFPQTAVNYYIFEFSKNNIFHEIENKEIKNFLSGSAGGSISMICTYPLETIRSRLSLQHSHGHYTGLINACKTIPVRDLYRGLRMSIMGFAPFTAISFSCYFHYKNELENLSIQKDIAKLLAGGCAGSTAISITYPTDLIRRRLQLQNFDKSVPKYTGILDCISKIIKTEGILGLYRGLFASYIKLFPTIGIQFLAMEKLNYLLKH
jgi:hypothetical protein|tara:strand:- start:4176 stop:4979 length:804 start_codon:yes stop_codon:yes gene_type:complete